MKSICGALALALVIGCGGGHEPSPSPGGEIPRAPGDPVPPAEPPPAAEPSPPKEPPPTQPPATDPPPSPRAWEGIKRLDPAEASAFVGARVLGDGRLQAAGVVKESDAAAVELMVATFSADGTVERISRLRSETERSPHVLGAVLDAVGNAYVLSRVHEEQQGLVSKLSADGRLLWEHPLPDGAPRWPSVNAIALDPTGGVVVVGRRPSEAFATKLDARGTVSWSRQFHAAGYESVWLVAVDGDGNVHLVGVFEEGAGGWQLATLAPGGEVLRVATLPPQLAVPRAIEVGRDGGTYVVGDDDAAMSYPAMSYSWLGRFDREGREVWSRQLGLYHGQTLLLARGQVLVGGLLPSDGIAGGIVVAYDPATGEQVARTAFTAGAAGEEHRGTYVDDLAPAPDGSVFAVGRTLEVRDAKPFYVSRAFVAKLGPDGTVR